MLQLENTCLPLLFSSKRCQQDKIKGQFFKRRVQ